MIKHIISIAKKEFIHLFRDPRSLTISLLLPIFLLFLYGYSVTFDIKNTPMAVLDNCRSAKSRDLISIFTNSGYFVLNDQLQSESQFKKMLDSGRVKVIINIPSDFERKLSSDSKAEIQVLIDGSDPVIASSALSYINGIAQQYSRSLLVKAALHSPIKINSPINLIARIWYNENLRSLNFYIPGLISTILMMMSASLTSLCIVSEKEMGTMEALIASPIRKNELMLGKILPYVIIAFWDVVLISAVGSIWFHVPIKGSLLLLYLCSFIFLTGALGIGLLFSTIAKTSQEAMQLSLLTTMLPSILLSGFMFPIENMPKIVQLITFLVPARYYLNILRGIFLKGVGLAYIWKDLLLLSIFTFIVIRTCIASFKKRIE